MLPGCFLLGGVLCAQAPLFNDSPAWGGSQVFSEGLSPKGSPASFAKVNPGFYLSYSDGENRPKDQVAHLEHLLASGKAEDALQSLNDQTWALRARGYGLSWSDQKTHFSLSREDMSGLLLHPDLAPERLGSQIALNQSRGDIRRAVVDRLAFGGGEMTQQASYGAVLRVERWQLSRSMAYFNPSSGQLLLGSQDHLDLRQTMQSPEQKSTSVAVDVGSTYAFVPGIRVGLTVDRLWSRRFHDVKEDPQYRVGAQFELGQTTQLSLEADLNQAMRLPFPVKQRSASASLRLAPSPAFTLVFGASRREMGNVAVMTGGATFWLRMPSLTLGASLQISNDRPVKGFTLATY